VDSQLVVVCKYHYVDGRGYVRQLVVCVVHVACDARAKGTMREAGLRGRSEGGLAGC
jgi:hypothetical protein